MFVEVNLKVTCTCVCGNQMLHLNVQLFMPRERGHPARDGKEKIQRDPSGQVGLANPSWWFNIENQSLSDVVCRGTNFISSHALNVGWELCMGQWVLVCIGLMEAPAGSRPPTKPFVEALLSHAVSHPLGWLCLQMEYRVIGHSQDSSSSIKTICKNYLGVFSSSTNSLLKWKGQLSAMKCPQSPRRELCWLCASLLSTDRNPTVFIYISKLIHGFAECELKGPSGSLLTTWDFFGACM